MTYSSIVISSGHSTKCQGASGILNEVAEATRVVDRVAKELKDRGIDVKAFHDTVSTTQNENLNRIVNYHNAQTRQLDVSVHFNAYTETAKPMGTECLYVTQSSLAKQMSSAIADCGFIDRGPKKRTDLFFLNNTAMPAILIEVAFVDSEADAEIYKTHFDLICENIAALLAGEENVIPLPPPDQGLHVTGKCSHFGGPDDTGVAPDEGLAFIYDVMDAPHLFLPYQPDGTTGLARRLNSVAVNYVACRWDYSITSKEMLASSDNVALVRATKTGLSAKAFPADWGPHEQKTGRAADLSPCLMDALEIATDDEVTVTYPYREEL
jgi:N-acetylmuramoyl-L-alanine amidase